MYMNLDLLNLQMNLLWTLKLKYHLNLHDAPWMTSVLKVEVSVGD